VVHRMSKTPAYTPSDALRVLLTAGAATVPGARYAMGCVAVVGGVAVVLQTMPNPVVAVLGGVILLASTVLAAIVGRLAAGRDAATHTALLRPALVLAWGVVSATMCVLALVISTTFWGVPVHADRSRCTGAAPATCCTETAPSYQLWRL
jgi:hypothetical protein